MKKITGDTNSRCASNSSLVFVCLLIIVANTLTVEGTLGDASNDLSKDTSDDEKEAVFKSINPLEAAILPVCLKDTVTIAGFRSTRLT